MRLIARSIVVILVVLGTSIAVIFLGGLQSYAALTDETLIAELSFRPRVDGGYDALLETGDRCTTRRFTLYGEQWQIDAEFIKWRYWASLLGMDSRYRLDRLRGRYTDAAVQNTMPASAHALDDRGGSRLDQITAALGRLNPFFDASYGSSTYAQIDPEHIFRIYKTPSGIVTRSMPATFPVLAGDYLDLNIDKACGAKPGFLARLFGAHR